jgi:fermentation-respiration switch protein FrsA (DUF1100 family)
MVFHPRPYDDASRAPSDKGIDVALETPNQVAIQARWYPQPGSTGAILYCPGNAGNLQGRAALVQDLWVNLGQSVLIFDYPGFGKSGGAPTEAGCYEAADAAYQWLVREAKMPPERILLYGESLGGGVAVDLATKRPHAALVLVRTFTSLPDVADYQLPVLPSSLIMTNRFDSVSKIGKCPKPVFIAQAELDKIIPVRQGEQLRRACQSPSQLFVLRGVGHNDPLPTDFYPALRAFLVQKTAIASN